uniref:Uncharacterized protein n=1 Tax=Rhizophora mucronata TaxID=61149 RepID=A0A2P2KCD0_RHIMU
MADSMKKTRSYRFTLDSHTAPCSRSTTDQYSYQAILTSCPVVRHRSNPLFLFYVILTSTAFYADKGMGLLLQKAGRYALQFKNTWSSNMTIENQFIRVHWLHFVNQLLNLHLSLIAFVFRCW